VCSREPHVRVLALRKSFLSVMVSMLKTYRDFIQAR
jgi:hypothetical protein